MPFKSRAQRRKFAELLVKGEISEEAYERWNRETGSAKLPEYAHAKARPGTRSRKKSKPKSKPRGKSSRKRR